MGATLASFANREEAEKFAATAGGKLVRFSEITLEMLSSLKSGSRSWGKCGLSGFRDDTNYVPEHNQLSFFKFLPPPNPLLLGGGIELSPQLGDWGGINLYTKSVLHRNIRVTGIRSTFTCL